MITRCRTLAFPFILIITLLGCGPTGSGSGSDASDATGAIDAADVLDVVGPDRVYHQRPDTSVVDAPFMPGAHAPYPQVPDQGGPRMTNPRLVVITYQDDTNRQVIEAHAQWMVSSSWLTAVGTEYGVASASILGMNELSVNAPVGGISFADVENMLATGIANHSLTTPMDGDFSNVIYMVFYPMQTDIGDSSGESCQTFTGYHDTYPAFTTSDAGVPGLQFVYAAVPFCYFVGGTLTNTQRQQGAASHEFIEAATDPFPNTQPAFTYFNPAQTTLPSAAWALTGGEIGDMCVYETALWQQGGFSAQRIWSNAAAVAHPDGDPCVPSLAGVTYFNTSVSPTGCPDLAIRPDDRQDAH